MITVRYDKPSKLPTLQSIFLSFNYNNDYINIIRSFPDRIYHTKTKEWELPINALEYLQRRIDTEWNIIGEPKEEEIKKIEHYSLPKGLRTKPYSFQEEGFIKLMNYDKHLLLDSTGLGKSLSMIAVALKRKELGQIEHCLIIPCVNSLKLNWREEIKEHTGMYAHILGYKGKVSISNKEKAEDLDDLKDFFLITNIESLRDKEFLTKLKNLIKSNKIGMLVVDECHRASNIASKQGKALLNVCNYSKYTYLLSGTPLVNSPLNAYLSLKCVGREVSNFTQFKSRYVVFGGFGNYQVIGYRNLEELQLKIDMVSLRRTKEEVLDLPEQIFKDEYLEMGEAQRRVYENVKKRTLQDLDINKLAINPLAQIIRLRQATAFTSLVSDTVNESVKLGRLREILEDTEGKVIIFTNWVMVVNKLKEELKEYNPAIYTGQERDRDKELDKFRNDDSCKIIIATSSSLGTGFTLTNANTMIFMDEMWHYSGMKQCYDRIHRIGTTKTTTVYTLICKNTIDEWVHGIVKKKRLLGDAVVDKKYNLGSPEVLKFLISGEGEFYE